MEFRDKFLAGNRNLGVISIELASKAIGLDELTHLQRTGINGLKKTSLGTFGNGRMRRTR